MSYSEANRQRYAQESSQAAFLEAEWSDYLLGQDADPTAPIDPLGRRAGPGFYQTVGQLTRDWSSAHDGSPRRYCDVGGSTGRAVYELAGRIDSLEELVLVEPSLSLAHWAEQLLREPAGIDWIPVIHDSQGVSWARVHRRPENRFPEKKNLFIYPVDSDSVPRPPDYFDLITCLNVVDRVAAPSSLVRALHRLLSPGGLLVLSSPLEFDEQFTPERERWITDLRDLLDDSAWISVDSTDVLYDFRLYRRGWIRYSSQVVCARKRGAESRSAGPFL